MEFLEDASLICCLGLCCVGGVGFVMSATLLRRLGNLIGDTPRKGRRLVKSSLDFDNVIDQFLKK